MDEVIAAEVIVELLLSNAVGVDSVGREPVRVVVAGASCQEDVTVVTNEETAFVVSAAALDVIRPFGVECSRRSESGDTEVLVVSSYGHDLPVWLNSDGVGGIDVVVLDGAVRAKRGVEDATCGVAGDPVAAHDDDPT